MRDRTVARNYAEALLEVGRRHDIVERCGELIDGVAGVFTADPVVRATFMSPRVDKATKQQLIAHALRKVAPIPFVRFLQSMVQRGRQGIVAEIAEEYELLVDGYLERVHAVITTARPADQALRDRIARRLAEVFGKPVRPHFRTEPALIGGVTVRSGDRVFDGSLRRRLRLLRHQMLHARLGGGERSG